MNVREGSSDALLYTGPVTIVQGKGEARIPVYGDFSNGGLKVTATGANKTMETVIQVDSPAPR